MRDIKPFAEPKPLLQALEYADRVLGFDTWDLMKDWTRYGQLRMRGLADGVTQDFEPHWFDFIAKWGCDDPVGTPDQWDDLRPPVGPGRTSDRPGGSTFDHSEIDNATVRMRPRLNPPENILYFDRPTQKQLSSGVTVPVRVSGIVVEMLELRRLIDQRKVNGVWRRRVGRPAAHKTSIGIFTERRDAGVPLPRRQIDEAMAILEQWPAGHKPLVKTVSEHISSAWRACKSGDKP